jgi:hypothetical protein
MLMGCQVSAILEVRSLTQLPTENVIGIYTFASRILRFTPWGHADEGYYFRMRELAITELESRTDELSQQWRASFGEWSA